MQISLQELFGANAFQDINRVVISKLDFPNLLATNSNTAESLLVAILINACDRFSGTVTSNDGTPIIDNDGIPITYNNSALYDLLNIFYWKRQFLKTQIQPKTIDTFVVEINEIQPIQ